MANGNGILRFLACGSVDDGKSTLIGHLLHLSGNLYDDQVLMLQQESAQLGTAGEVIDYSLLLDGLSAEREQGITIDVAYRYFITTRRHFIVADTPGHERYTRNMATAASRCSAALILVDARQGVLPQTRRHVLICALMGIRRLLFAVNKMDTTGWSEQTFREIQAQCNHVAVDLERFGLPPAECLAIPVSGLFGDNLTHLSTRMPWYDGLTVMGWLHAIAPGEGMLEAPSRFPVQYVIKVARSGGNWQEKVEQDLRRGGTGTFRAYAGTVVSGSLKCGDPVAVLPSGLRTRIRELWCGDGPMQNASAGMSVALCLEGEHDIVRGDMIVADDRQMELAYLFKVRLVWMDDQPLYAGRHYLFKGLAGTATAGITRIRGRIEPDTYQRLAADHFMLNDIGEVELSLSRPIPFDPYGENRETGGFILTDRLSNTTVACGMILHALRRADNVPRQCEEVAPPERAAIKGQQPCVIWLTGLSGAGKSTIANCLERKLHTRGRHTMLLDGDNIRQGLNRDLGFTEAGRIENIRRIGEVAKLMTDAGLIVITAFISPFRAERTMVREILPAGRFVEIHVDTPLEECERRDPKGLYRKVRQGMIPNFTGIDSPYEPPRTPELRLGTTNRQVGECADAIIDYLHDNSLL
ncbi:adenylyl-sulfate kinase [Geobacter sp. SVR]|uniref:adenylyl-sulfate kinase n=1 Tax=Geobacter sp. SVR TaxID=2495594 RepID=UPI00143F0494|nr:adenylyl-sulfate kinase [Geobacter sp. SVR]BCS52918.1 adenylyl-sulfate kinase [Geobacter sp. SVR]GCF84302.1 adenylyl-sulfate kinase [Geobacter sp. SVR]